MAIFWCVYLQKYLCYTLADLHLLHSWLEPNTAASNFFTGYAADKCMPSAGCWLLHMQSLQYNFNMDFKHCCRNHSTSQQGC